MITQVTFGPFVLDLVERSLRDRDVELRLGSRALDLLVALIERPGELVTHRDLLDRAWPGLDVDESSLRVHMSALRKALGDGQSGNRFVVNEHGRGYRFVGRVTPTHEDDGADHTLNSATPGLPAQIVRLLGREDAIQSLSSAMARSRLVTVAGPGGVGKSTLAIAWAERHAERFRDGARYVDLLPVAGVGVAGAWLTTALGLRGQVGASANTIAAALADRQTLLLLDNCEHLIDFAADFAEALLAQAPGVTILATSREALRTSSETLFRLPGLTLPQGTPQSLSEAALYPAVELFLERAAASSSIPVGEYDAATVAALCRRLDGIPLAIELAASWVDVMSIGELAAQLDTKLLSRTDWRRTANPHQRSLTATLEWSYDALDEMSQLVLDRLSVLQDQFALSTATAIAVDDALHHESVLEAIATLARKSLLQVDISGDFVRYRLLQTTRAFAQERLAARSDGNVIRRRHALACCDLLASAETDLLRLDWFEWLARYGNFLADTRAGLDWAFSGEGDPEVGVRLTLLSLQIGQQVPPFGEYLRHIDAALASLEGAGPSSRVDALRLDYARGSLLTNISGDDGTLRSVAEDSAALEAEIGRALPEAIMAQFLAALTSGDFPRTLEAARRMNDVGEQLAADEVKIMAMRMEAQAEHFLGHHATATSLAQRVLDSPFEFLPLTQVSHKVSMRIVLARTAFLQDDADRARRLVDDALELAGRSPVAIAQTLALVGIPLGLWMNDHPFTVRGLAQFREITRDQQLPFWAKWITAYEAVATLDRSVSRLLEPGTSPLLIDMLPTIRPELLTPQSSRRVAEGLVGWNAPEIYRAEAIAASDKETARSLATRALSLAQQHGAHAWTSRAAQTLNRLSPVELRRSAILRALMWPAGCAVWWPSLDAACAVLSCAV